MIHIVSETHNEGIPLGQRWNLHQRDSAPHDQVPQECDMQLQCGGASVRGRLSPCEQTLNLAEQVITHACEQLVFQAIDESDRFPGVFAGQDLRAPVEKRGVTSIEGQRTRGQGEVCFIVVEADLDFQPDVKLRFFAGIQDQESGGRELRFRIACAEHDLILPLVAIKLPGNLKQFKKFANRAFFSWI